MHCSPVHEGSRMCGSTCDFAYRLYGLTRRILPILGGCSLRGNGLVRNRAKSSQYADKQGEKDRLLYLCGPLLACSYDISIQRCGLTAR